MENMVLRGYTARRSLIHTLDPRIKLIYLVFMTLLCLISSNPIYLMVLIGIIVTIAFLAKSTRLLLGYVKLLTGFSVFLLVIQAIFYHPPPGWEVTYLLHIPDGVPLIGGANVFSLEGVLFGFSMVLRLFIMVLAFTTVVLTTAPRDFLLAMVKMKAPYIFAFIATTALRFLPTLNVQLKIIREAQTSRAFAPMEAKGIRGKINAWIPLITPLFMMSFEKAENMTLAIETRAFGASVKRTYLYELKLRRIDWIFLLVNCAVLGIMLYLLFFTDAFTYFGRIV